MASQAPRAGKRFGLLSGDQGGELLTTEGVPISPNDGSCAALAAPREAKCVGLVTGDPGGESESLMEAGVLTCGRATACGESTRVDCCGDCGREHTACQTTWELCTWRVMSLGDERQDHTTRGLGPFGEAG
mmetsp:Transcript_31435/g.86537  ORF Transcript_31435/g.86537 Transcript_31435/m.86537 type:complete len:131 (+) Transcript_31435:335-727(+)